MVDVLIVVDILFPVLMDAYFVEGGIDDVVWVDFAFAGEERGDKDSDCNKS